jgi:uncharacterized membrane protein
MSAANQLSEHEIEQIIGRLLQVGVLIAGVVTLVGGVLLLLSHGSTTPSFSVFRGQPGNLTSLGLILKGAREGHGDSIVQLGIVLLIATPIARVAFTLVAFALQRDRTYVLITLLVLLLLMYGLFFGQG